MQCKTRNAPRSQRGCRNGTSNMRHNELSDAYCSTYLGTCTPLLTVHIMMLIRARIVQHKQLLFQHNCQEDASAVKAWK